MPFRFGEQREHDREYERCNEQDADAHHIRTASVECDGEMVEQPNGDNKQEKDNQGDD